MSFVWSTCAAMIALALIGCTGTRPEAAYDDKARMLWLGIRVEM